MDYKRFEFSIQADEDVQLTVFFDDDVIEVRDIHSYALDKDKVETTECKIDDKNTIYITFGLIDDETIEVYIEADNESFELNRIEIDITCKKEIIKELSFDLYVPTLSFTKTTSSILYGLADGKKVVPLIDITIDSRFESYNKDELINYKHYLDISYLKIQINKKEREDAKLLRKEEKKEMSVATTPIPDAKYRDIEFEEIHNFFKEITKKNITIPCFVWEEESERQEFVNFHDSLVNDFEEIAIRIVHFDSFKSHIDTVRKYKNIHIILDMANDHRKQYIKECLSIFSTSKYIKIIYLGTPFDAFDISIPYNDTDRINKNNIKSNTPLYIMQFLQQENFNSICYGDYCGYDKKTIVQYKGGTPTARVVLTSIDPEKNILVHRGWDSRDKTIRRGDVSIGSRHSMTKLLKDLNLGQLDCVNGIKYLDDELIDVDYSLKKQYPNNTTAGNIKTMCLRHNIITIINNYVR